MWLVSDWRWISGIFEVGLTDGQTLSQRCEDASKKTANRPIATRDTTSKSLGVLPPFSMDFG